MENTSNNNNKVMAVLAYLGPLVIISYLVSKNDPFVKFHIKQGLVLFVISIIMWVLGGGMFFYSFWMLWRIVHLAVIILSIIGIINVLGNKEKELPLVGQFGSYFKI